MIEESTIRSTTPEREIQRLERELADALAMNRSLMRQLNKTQTAAAEASRAHAKMVATLTETMRENTALSTERDTWRARALRGGVAMHESNLNDVLGIMALTPEEISVVRKAMARLHHPDVGGDPERMKAWNSALDRLED